MKLIITFFLAVIHLIPARGQTSAPPYGTLVSTGEFKLHMNITGTSGPLVIIEGGTAQWSIHWKKFQNRLSSEAKVITYDRAGYGWSEASPYPRTAGQQAVELHQALQGANLQPPYVLMGHSYGAFVMKSFLRMYPNEVKALILAEGANERQFDYLPEVVNDMLQYGIQNFKSQATRGREGKLKPADFPVDSLLESVYWAAYQESLARPSFYQSLYDEMYLLPMSFLQCKLTGIYKIPLLVVSAENSFKGFAKGFPDFPLAESNSKWMDLQREFLLPFPDHQHVILKSGWHDLAASAPDELLMHVKKFISNLK